MLVMLAYDVPETKHQTLLRKEFEALGGQVLKAVDFVPDSTTDFAHLI